MNRLLKDIQVLFQDDDLLVVNKPPRLLTLPDRYAADKPSLIQALKEKDPGIMVNHRLDKDTSGVIVFTRNPEAHAQLSRQFDQRTLTKTYLALVKGVVASDEGVIDQPIAAHPSEDGRMRIWKGEAISFLLSGTGTVPPLLLAGGHHRHRTHPSDPCPLRIHRPSVGGRSAVWQ